MTVCLICVQFLTYFIPFIAEEPGTFSAAENWVKYVRVAPIYKCIKKAKLTWHNAFAVSEVRLLYFPMEWNTTSHNTHLRQAVSQLLRLWAAVMGICYSLSLIQHKMTPWKTWNKINECSHVTISKQNMQG